MSDFDPGQNQRILVIDDNPSIHDDFRKILGAGKASTAALEQAEAALFGEPSGARRPTAFQVDSAYQGEEGLALVQAARDAGQPYALAFVDVRMPPGWDGVETTARLWEVDPDLQVVICTAYSDCSWEEMIDKIGHSDRLLILKKPFDTVEALQLANALTAKWRLLQQVHGKLADLERIVSARTQQLQHANAELLGQLTQRKQLEEQLLQAQKIEAIGRLAGGVAHDFNNILTAITGYSQLMLTRLDDQAWLRHGAEEIEKAAYRAAALTRQLLAFSRKQVLQTKVLDLGRVVADTEQMLRRLIGEDIEVSTQTVANLGHVKADPGQIEQVIVNLVVNARDAMPGGGLITIETANVTLDQPYARQHPEVTPGEYVMLAVSDTGTGMTGEVQAHMFEPFYTTKPQGQGTGLGLPTCYGIVKQSGGHIVAESAPGQGAVFRIYLPRVDQPADSVLSPQAVATRPRGTETVLLVEDEPCVREFATLLLEELGYQVLAAPDGVEALQLVANCDGQGIALVITDMVMPRLGGKALADQLRARYPDMKIMLTSGYTEEVIDRHGARETVFPFMPKPYTPTVLAHKVREILDNGHGNGKNGFEPSPRLEPQASLCVPVGQLPPR